VVSSSWNWVGAVASRAAVSATCPSDACVAVGEEVGGTDGTDEAPDEDAGVGAGSGAGSGTGSAGRITGNGAFSSGGTSVEGISELGSVTSVLTPSRSSPSTTSTATASDDAVSAR
jgi:hypothetical protein